VPMAAKVAVFKGEVGGNEELVVGRWFEDGTVVADAEADRAGQRGAGADAVDDRQFAEGICRWGGVGGIRHRFQSKSTRRSAVDERLKGHQCLLLAGRSIKMERRSSGDRMGALSGFLLDAVGIKSQKSRDSYDLAVYSGVWFSAGKEDAQDCRESGCRQEKHCGSALLFM